MRRGSFEPSDLAYAYQAGMDTIARGFEVAAALVKDRALDGFLDERYAGYDQEIGKRIESGKASLKELEEYALKNEEVKVKSGRQEYLEDLLNAYITGAKRKDRIWRAPSRRGRAVLNAGEAPTRVREARCLVSRIFEAALLRSCLST